MSEVAAFVIIIYSFKVEVDGTFPHVPTLH